MDEKNRCDDVASLRRVRARLGQWFEGECLPDSEKAPGAERRLGRRSDTTQVKTLQKWSDLVKERTKGAVVENRSMTLAAREIPGAYAFCLPLLAGIITRNRKYTVEKRPALIEHLRSWKEAFLSLFTTMIIFSGMIGGIFTSPEAASVAVLYSLFLGRVVYRNVTWEMLLEDSKKTVLFCSDIYTIVAASMVLSFIFTRENIGTALVGYILQSALPPAAVVFFLPLYILMALMVFFSRVVTFLPELVTK